ncbi:glycoside hydrolase family 20 protein [Phanerochaete carnosa HHB-10118-sp]|uniref:Beta-hexosaminidase n=1 Tax=Phanerochaete carnosa (strain HHB-10118-sp) TaxID=650164 RepID=K5VSS1_PHACS|nr:glycoside hydrolase family 20 protein [Phanerochaete carnosa HHB-10118-sp]EKM49790.1 glycoside hydrolase family 20 protein [Phanerochaete carnosa HHB-10118-sp]
MCAQRQCYPPLGKMRPLQQEASKAFALIALAISFVVPVTALWPIPRQLETGSTPLVLASDFKIDNLDSPPSDLGAAVARTLDHLSTDKLERLVVGRASADKAAVQDAKALPSLVLAVPQGAKVNSIADEAIMPLGSRSEEYTLTIPSDGSPATLTANSTLGLFRGLTTFEQFWYDLDGAATYTLEAPVSITDFPAFPYRGLMLDTARNFFSVSDIKRTLDAMSWAKINQFHWHITDSQSFPVQIPGFTEVADKGAYSSSMIYSPSDVQDIVTYAAQRGIDVLPEIDTPGHTSIIAESHPEYVACFVSSPWSEYAGEPPSGQLRFASPATRNFTAELLASTATMFPSSLFSTGGDELNVPCYTADNETQAILNATGETLYQALDTFTQSTHGALRGIGKTPVVWEEMVLDYNTTLGNDTVVMVWISSANAAAVAEKNFKIVHGPSDYFYLDCGAGEWIGDDPSGNSWCDPFKTWQKSYTFDPYANISESMQHLVLGGQQLLWTEQSSPENMDSIIWPRAASSAEVFWTGATLPDGSPRNGSSALPRLHDFRFRMVQRGVRAIPLQPLWCALRPGLCNLDS